MTIAFCGVERFLSALAILHHFGLYSAFSVENAYLLYRPHLEPWRSVFVSEILSYKLKLLLQGAFCLTLNVKCIFRCEACKLRVVSGKDF